MNWIAIFLLLVASNQVLILDDNKGWIMAKAKLMPYSSYFFSLSVGSIAYLGAYVLLPPFWRLIQSYIGLSFPPFILSFLRFYVVCIYISGIFFLLDNICNLLYLSPWYNVLYIIGHVSWCHNVNFYFSLVNNKTSKPHGDKT